MRRPDDSAFSMIEVAIAIAVIAILAGSVAPLALRALNQQRAQKTRENLQTAYEAMVGSRSKSVSNMRADFGFTPPAVLQDLRFMTTINPAATYRNGVIPMPYPNTFQGMSWGWNGPYWTGTVGPNREPLDGWGRALRWNNNQVQSRGADGNWNTTDDIAYPTSALALAASTLYITVERQLPAPPLPSGIPTTVTLSIHVYDRYNNQTHTQPPTSSIPPSMADFAFSGSATHPFGPYSVIPGPVSVTLQATSAVPAVPNLAAYDQGQIIMIAPGESRTVLFRLNN